MGAPKRRVRRQRVVARTRPVEAEYEARAGAVGEPEAVEFESVSESATDSEPESGSATEPESESESATDSDSDSESATATEPVSESESVSDPEAAADPLERVALHGAGVVEHGERADRLQVTVLVRPDSGSTLAADVGRGLREVPKTLEPKHFYDDVGSTLFDMICDTPEYYVTRTEEALLEEIADEVIGETSPTALVELGSGAARKTRALLEAMQRHHGRATYVPVDISEQALESSAAALLEDYDWLDIHGVVADFTQHLHRVPGAERRLIAFLGGTLGNFDRQGARGFLQGIRDAMTEGDSLLVGMDQVKQPAILHAAYNDAAGVTAAFNRNLLQVINRELSADFDVDAFEHVALYRPELQRIEMLLEARSAQSVTIEALGRQFDFGAGERVRTEISSKFTRESAEALFAAAGLTLRRWYTPENGYFALALAGIDG